MYKKVGLLTAFILATLLGEGLAVTRVTSQRKDPLSHQTVQQIPDEATPIQEGVVTEKQKKHGELFSSWFQSGRVGKLRDRVVAGAKDLEIEITGDSPQELQNGKEVKSFIAEVRFAIAEACNK